MRSNSFSEIQLHFDNASTPDANFKDNEDVGGLTQAAFCSCRVNFREQTASSRAFDFRLVALQTFGTHMGGTGFQAERDGAGGTGTSSKSVKTWPTMSVLSWRAVSLAARRARVEFGAPRVTGPREGHGGQVAAAPSPRASAASTTMRRPSPSNSSLDVTSIGAKSEPGGIV